MSNLEEALRTRPALLGKYLIPLEQIQLPDSFGGMAELDFNTFVKQFCRTYGLMEHNELANYGFARVGKEGLEKLYGQYQARLKHHKALELKTLTDARRRTLLTRCLGATVLLAGLDQGLKQAVNHDLDQDALQWAEGAYAEETDRPFAVHSTKYFPSSLDHVESHKNSLDMAGTTMLMNCHAEGYVLTECRDGRVYRPFPYSVENPVDDCKLEVYQNGTDEEGKPKFNSYRHGACGETFFELDGYHGYGWDSKTPGKIKDTYYYSDRYRYHPVSPSAEDLCVDKKTGVYIAPIVHAERDQALPATCRAAGVFPVMNH